MIRRWVAPIALLLSAGSATASTLQIDTPFEPASMHGGTVGAVALTATSSRWAADFGDESSVYGSAAFGALALSPGTVGDFFRINLGASARSDTFSITFSDPIRNPIFYLIDLQGLGGTVRVTPGGTTFTTNPDGSWSGDVLTITDGFPTGSASAAVQYSEAFAAGSAFTLQFDYSNVPSSLQNDTIGIAIATPIPEPALLGLIACAGAFLAARRSARHR